MEILFYFNSGSPPFTSDTMNGMSVNRSLIAQPRSAKIAGRRPWRRSVLLVAVHIFLMGNLGSQKALKIKDYLAQANQAYLEKKYPLFLNAVEVLNRLRPHDTQIMYNLAVANALNGRQAEALAWLNRLVELGLPYRLTDDLDLQPLRNTVGYRNLLARYQRLRQPLCLSQAAFSLPEKDLIPESIAWDPLQKCFYAGSLYKRKIVQIDAAGRCSDFTAERQDGLWSVVGIKIDAPRRTLWACSAAEPIMKEYQADTLGRLTAIFVYDLDQRKLKKKYLLPDQGSLHLFNDLAINGRGDVFISDYLGGAVYTIQAASDELALWIHPEDLAGPNGITLSEDGTILFVAHASGIAAFDAASKGRRDILHPPDITLTETDGLYFYHNSLIAVQTEMQRVNRYYLSPDNRQVARHEIMDAYRPEFDMPTTGVVVDGAFYYIANSQYASFDEAGRIFPFDKLKHTLILKCAL